jgi:hypothetical protein
MRGVGEGSLAGEDRLLARGARRPFGDLKRKVAKEADSAIKSYGP